MENFDGKKIHKINHTHQTIPKEEVKLKGKRIRQTHQE